MKGIILHLDHIQMEHISLEFKSSKYQFMEQERRKTTQNKKNNFKAPTFDCA